MSKREDFAGTVLYFAVHVFPFSDLEAVTAKECYTWHPSQYMHYISGAHLNMQVLFS